MRPYDLLVVRCKECGEEHYSFQVQTLNIEEDPHGYDLVAYICPRTDKTTESRVYATG